MNLNILNIEYLRHLKRHFTYAFILLIHTELCNVGQQEYSARTAGITSGIVLAVIIPIILLLLFCVFTIFKKQKRGKLHSAWVSGTLSRPGSRLRINEIPDNRPISDNPSDDSYTYNSPEISERNYKDWTKKRRSYDGSYKTNEPIKGLPDVNFEEKNWDVDSEIEKNPDYFSDISSLPSSHVNSSNRKYKSNPNIFDSPESTARRDKLKSQSSMVTDV